MKQINLLRTTGRKINVSFKSASRLFMVVVMMLLASSQVGAQEAQEAKMYVVKSDDGTTATAYFDNLYDERGCYFDIDRFNGYGRNVTTFIFDKSFKDARPTSTAHWFDFCYELTEIIGIENLTTSNVMNMSGMFRDCVNLTDLDLSNFDTSNVTYMSGMFESCKSLTDLDLSHFDTSNVTDMSYMFCNYGSDLTSLDLSHFDTSNVTDMSSMFDSCNLTSLDLSHFDTGNVMDMGSMFAHCFNLTSLDLNNFDTSNVTNMEDMFFECLSLTSLDLSHFDTSNVTDMIRMFGGCESLTSLDLSNFDTGNIMDMSSMFDFCFNLISLDLSHFDTGNVMDMSGMFVYCANLTDLDLSHFDTGNVTDMNSMFCGCESLTSLDLSHFDTGNVTDMKWMFSSCHRLTSLDLSHFDTGNVMDMSGMFAYCANLTDLDLSHFDTGNVTDMNGMFYGCENLTSLDLSHFDTSNVTNMEDMFRKCSSLESISIGEKMTQMPSFSGCEQIKRIVSYQKEPSAIASDCFADDVKENAKLHVPNDAVALYKTTDGWKEFKHIMGKDLEPEDGENPGLGTGAIDENTDLNGNIVSNVFLNIPADAGEYDAAEGCIILKKATTGEQMDNIMGLDLYSSYLLNNFNGMIFMVNGSGTMEFEVATTGEMMLAVKIGEGEPTTKHVGNKDKVSIPYDVTEPTFVYIYATMPAAQNAKGMRKANGAENALKIYSVKWGEATGISNIHTTADSDAAIYNLNGQRVTASAKGVYIVGGKKVIMK